jgi:hypothetical protein
MPGFTAEVAVCRTIGQYRVMAAAAAAMEAVMPALQVGGGPGYQWIDCNHFPENMVCRECGYTGPESIQCCTNPDNCIVIDQRVWWTGLL